MKNLGHSIRNLTSAYCVTRSKWLPNCTVLTGPVQEVQNSVWEKFGPGNQKSQHSILCNLLDQSDCVTALCIQVLLQEVQKSVQKESGLCNLLDQSDCVTTLCLQALLQEVQNSVREKFGTRSKWLPNCTVTDLKQNEAQSAHAESTHKGVNLCSKDVTRKNNNKEDATLYLQACQVRVIVGDSGLCCCVCVMSF